MGDFFFVCVDEITPTHLVVESVSPDITTLTIQHWPRQDEADVRPNWQEWILDPTSPPPVTGLRNVLNRWYTALMWTWVLLSRSEVIGLAWMDRLTTFCRSARASDPGFTGCLVGGTRI